MNKLQVAKKIALILMTIVLSMTAVGVVLAASGAASSKPAPPPSSSMTAMNETQARWISISLSQVATAMGMQRIIYGATDITGYSELNLSVTNPLSGVYVIKASRFACTIGISYPNQTIADPLCEPDRYEIQYSSTVKNIYGLGSQVLANQVLVTDFLDSNFSSGHLFPPPTIDAFEPDIGRMRTPVFVLPEKNTIIAYLQPAVKRLRLTRDGTNKCPRGYTCLVLKKHETFPEGAPAELVLVKGNSINDAYTKYYNYLRFQKGLYFKPPIRQAFGVNWETYDELGCSSTITSIVSTIIPSYATPLPAHPDLHIQLSSLAIGSGYWKGWRPGCPEDTLPPTGPGTESLVVNPVRFIDKSHLQSLFDELLRNGTYPMLGMRHHVISNTYVSTNLQRIEGLFATQGVTNPWWDRHLYSQNFSTTYMALMLNTGSAKVMTAWINLLRNDTVYNGVLYGYANNLKGIKEDDNGITDQQGLGPNWADNRISLSYRAYNDYFHNDFLIFGRNDWFGVGTDGQNTQGWLALNRYTPPSPFGGYKVKYYLDAALAQVVSGYPHPNSVFGVLWNGYGTDIPSSTAKAFLRTNQLVTFFGVTTISRGFWHLTTNQAYQEAVVFYNRLRTRLQQYAYDQAQHWYETGVPWLMQPLFIRWPTDPNSHSLYGIPAQVNSPTDEFMFGNALLIRPVFTDVNTVTVYLPAGKWKRFMQTNTSAITGPLTMNYSLGTDSGNASDYPIFLKEGEILVIGNYTNPAELWAYVFLDSTNSNSSEYYFHRSDGSKVKLQASRDTGVTVTLTSQVSNTITTKPMGDDPYGKGFKIINLADLGVSY